MRMRRLKNVDNSPIVDFYLLVLCERNQKSLGCWSGGNFSASYDEFIIYTILNLL